MSRQLVHGPLYRYVVTRDPHVCIDCHTSIPTGSWVLFIKYRLGVNHSWYCCRECDLGHINALPDMDRTNRLLKEREMTTLADERPKIIDGVYGCFSEMATEWLKRSRKREGEHSNE